jgi:signal peptidase
MTARDVPPRTIAAAAGILFVLAFAIPLWPQALGGSTAYVVPRGASMEPKLSNGDLAFVRSQSSYRVGDVVGYRNTSLHRVVVHRVVAVDNGTYTLKGDANAFKDPQPVRASQLVGRLSFNLPLLGGLLLWLTSPINLLLLLALGALLVHDRDRLLAALRRRAVTTPAPRPVASEVVAVPSHEQRLRDNDRVVPIRDMSFPHELAVAEVVGSDRLLRLADRYDRPVLYDEGNGELYVIESNMLFRCVLEAAASIATSGLAIVRELAPEPTREPDPAPVMPARVTTATAARDITPPTERERRHSWPSRRQYGGRRKPSPQGRDWVYASEK